MQQWKRKGMYKPILCKFRRDYWKWFLCWFGKNCESIQFCSQNYIHWCDRPQRRFVLCPQIQWRHGRNQEWCHAKNRKDVWIFDRKRNASERDKGFERYDEIFYQNKQDNELNKKFNVMSRKKYYLFIEIRNPFEDEIPEKCMGCPVFILTNLEGPMMGLCVANEKELDDFIYSTVKTHDTLKDLLVIDLKSNSAKLMFGVDLDDVRIENLKMKIRCLFREFKGTDVVLDSITDARKNFEEEMNVSSILMKYELISYKNAFNHLNWFKLLLRREGGLNFSLLFAFWKVFKFRISLTYASKYVYSK